MFKNMEKIIKMNVKIYVINLKKRPHRLNYFQSYYKFEEPYEAFEAVDGESINEDELLKTNIIGDIGYQSIKNTKNNIPRKYHYELGTNGAIGCALSHINIYKKLVKDYESTPILDNPYVIIFEDDALVNNLTLNEIKERIQSLPEDWHYYQFGAGRPITYEHIKDNLYKLSKFQGTHAYAISLKGAKWLLNHEKMYPFNQQFDSHLSELATDYGFNVYIHSNVKYILPYRNQSDIQAPIDEQSNSYDRLKL
jgi:GR25 family glycosyltransferase involved in LPS biosynthesis